VQSLILPCKSYQKNLHIDRILVAAYSIFFLDEVFVNVLILRVIKLNMVLSNCWW